MTDIDTKTVRNRQEGNAMSDERCICGDLEPAHARIHCPVHGLFAGLTREQLRERCARLQQAIAKLDDPEAIERDWEVVSAEALAELRALAGLDTPADSQKDKMR